MKKYIASFIATLSLLAFLLVPVSVSAASLWNPFGEACNQGGSTNDSAACSKLPDKCSQDPEGHANDPDCNLKGNVATNTINRATAIVGMVAGAAAIILLTIAGFMFMDSPPLEFGFQWIPQLPAARFCHRPARSARRHTSCGAWHRLPDRCTFHPPAGNVRVPRSWPEMAASSPVSKAIS